MTHVLDCFDGAFVINADDQPERLSKVSLELARVGIPFERHSAITNARPSSLLRASEVSLTLSHCAIVNMARERRYKNVLILEDDVVFRPDFLEQWKRVSSQVGRLEYDLLYFYDWHAEQLPSEPHLARIIGTLCTHAYCVSARYYDSFLDTLDRYQQLAAIDQMLLRVDAEKWAIVPNLIGQEGGISSIYGAPRALRWSAQDG